MELATVLYSLVPKYSMIWHIYSGCMILSTPLPYGQHTEDYRDALEISGFFTLVDWPIIPFLSLGENSAAKPQRVT